MLVNPYNGYYVYKNNNIGTASEVLECIIKNKDANPDLRLWFHDEEYSKYDWSKEPDVDIQKLYTERAKQLREEYDYLILQFSGGSDSSQILQTFLKNDIFIDEVRSIYPVEVAKAFSKNIQYNDHLNDRGFYWEFFATCLPQLKQLSEKSPKTKINVVDYSERYINEIKNDYIIENNKDIFIFTSFSKTSTTQDGSWWNSIRNIVTQKSLEDTENLKHKKIGVIIGADKPKFYIDDNRLYFNFTSFGRSQPGVQPTLSNNRYIEELFYWSPSAPLIPIKQSHMILNSLNASPSFMESFINAMNGSRVKFYESTFVKQLLYPYFNKNYYYKDKFFDGSFIGNDTSKNVIMLNEKVSFIKKQLSILSIPEMIPHAASKKYFVGYLHNNRGI